MAKFKSIAMRFIKAFVAGAFTTVGMVTFAAPTTWTQMGQLLNMIGIAAVFGGITGVLMAGEKWYNWKDTIK